VLISETLVNQDQKPSCTWGNPEVLKDSLKIKKGIKYGILSLIKIKILSL